jgi:hypothetical protein
MKILKKYVSYADLASAVVVGNTVPGDMVVDAGVFVKTPFNGTTPTFDMGFAGNNQGGSADPNALASAIAAGVAGVVKADELGAATNKICTVADQVTVTFNVASGTPSAGEGWAYAVIMNVHPDNAPA